MSNAFAIAAVTAAFRTALQGAVVTPAVSDALGGGNLTVSAIPPDRVNPNGGEDPNQLNLFLYAVSPNTGWSNEHQPVRSGDGVRVDNQPLALDLHYLLTAYAAKPFGAEILLGHGMQALHEAPFLGRQWLRDTFRPGSLPNDVPASLATTGLSEQVEQIRITPKPLTLDEMSKIWTAVQGRYRPTAAYVATVVLIEGRRPARSALPVRERDIRVMPFAALQLDAAGRTTGAGGALGAGDTLRLRGSGFARANLQVRLSGVDLSAGIARRTDEELDVVLPDPLPAGLRAGLLPVQLVLPGVGSMELASNAVGVLVRPSLTAAPTHAAGKVRVKLAPAVTASQRVLLLLNERQPAAGTTGKAFSVAAPERNGIVSPATETDTIAFPSAGLASGTYVVRVQVDGAESALEQAADGRFDRPKVTIP